MRVARGNERVLHEHRIEFARRQTERPEKHERVGENEGQYQDRARGTRCGVDEGKHAFALRGPANGAGRRQGSMMDQCEARASVPARSFRTSRNCKYHALRPGSSRGAVGLAESLRPSSPMM